MDTSEISTMLLALSTALVKAVTWMAKSKRDQRDRVAVHCEGIASCLKDAQVVLERGEIPHGRCSEMDQYMRDLRGVLGEILPAAEFERLRDALTVAYHVENLGRELPARTGPDLRFPELAEAAGKFQAVASRLRSTKQPGLPAN